MTEPNEAGTLPVSRRAKYLTLLALVVGSGLTLLASTQPWFVVHLTDVGEHSATISVAGSAAAPALTALSLAGLALAAALAIAGPVFRLVLALLGVLLGVSVLISAGSAVGDALQASSATITTSTGVAGTASIARLVSRADTALWPWLAIAGGVVLVLASVAVFVTSRLWPGASRRYQTRFEGRLDADVDGDDDGEDSQAQTHPAAAPVTDATTPSTPDAAATGQEEAEPAHGSETDGPRIIERDAAIDSWDELSRGEDPTR